MQKTESLRCVFKIIDVSVFPDYDCVITGFVVVFAFMLIIIGDVTFEKIF